MYWSALFYPENMKCSLMNREISRNGKGSSNFSWGCGEESLRELIGTLGGRWRKHNEERSGWKFRIPQKSRAPRYIQMPEEKGVVAIFQRCTIRISVIWKIVSPSSFNTATGLNGGFLSIFSVLSLLSFHHKQPYLLYAIRITGKELIRTFGI